MKRLLALTAALACLAPAVAHSAPLPDGRGWEMVSPVDKNGGEIAAAGDLFGGGVFQAAADGQAVTYSSASSFAGGPLSAPPASQYIATKVPGGWSNENLNVSVFSGSYGADPDGVPYQLFSSDLARGLLLNGRHCRSVEAACPVANPALAGTDAPAGYVNYYLRGGAGFEALMSDVEVTASKVGPANFDLRLAGATPDLSHLVLESCAALAPGATEVTLGAGCDPAKQNLYAWSGGALSLLNAAPGAELAASAGAISTDGTRVYFKNKNDGGLYLREGGSIHLVDLTASFQSASADGSVAYFTKAGNLYSYDAATHTPSPLSASGDVLGVLGASAAGDHVYYLTATGLFHRHGATATPVPTNGVVPTESSNFPPATGTARVSADGTRLLFLSAGQLTAYNNTDILTGLPDTEAYLYNATAGQLLCVSCRPNGNRPTASASIPGAPANGKLAGALATYKPRVLSADGNRVFFDSEDSLVSADVNKEPDVYEWQAQGPGCPKAAGCVALISSGRAEGGARFIDASASGDDAFFVTDESLVTGDPGSVDLYDARVGGGFPDPIPPIACLGDACEELPSEPVDPALNTLVSGPGNPKVRYFKYRRKAEGCQAKKKAAKAKKCKKQSKSAAKGKAKNNKKGGKR